MSKKLFTACLGTETNSLSPIPTGLDLFESTMMVRNGDFGEHVYLFGLPLVVWRERAAELGWDVAEGLAAFAMPAGDTTKAAFETLRDEVLADLESAMPVDAVLLNLHGAMVAEGYPDAEGHLLKCVRERVGDDVPLLAELDLHGHQTPDKFDAADVLVYYKEYPHVDAIERAHEVFNIAEAMLSGTVRPRMAVHDCKMLGIYPTTREPLQSFVARMKALERDEKILSVSLVHGFPWSNTPDLGTKVLVVTNDDQAKAESTAAELGEWVWDNRNDIVAPFISMDDAFDKVEASGKHDRPFVLADTADNTGLGAAGDSTYVISRLLERNLTGYAIAPLWDPVAVSIAFDAGLNANIKMRIGGKTGEASGSPLDLQVSVKGLVRDAFQPFGGSSISMGDMAWLRIEPSASSEAGLDVIINSCRVQAMDLSCFSATGFNPLNAKALVVKSTQHFYAGFAPIAEEVFYMASPGCGTMQFAEIAHPLLTRELWPVTENPHSI